MNKAIEIAFGDNQAMKLLGDMLMNKYKEQFEAFDLLPVSDSAKTAIKTHVITLCVANYLDGLMAETDNGTH